VYVKVQQQLISSNRSKYSCSKVQNGKGLLIIFITDEKTAENRVGKRDKKMERREMAP